MKLNVTTCVDGYKINHGPMYADGTNKVYSNLTPRTDKIYRRNCTEFYDGKIVWVGAQGAVQEIHELWEDTFFSKPKEEVIGRYAKRMVGYLGCEVAATNQLASLHDLGYLPLKIKSLPEGSLVTSGIPVLTFTNTVDEFFWLVNYHETLISDLTWKTSTNATIAREYKKICQHFAKVTGVDDFTVSIQCHDFSMRGMSGPEDAARAGFGHLTQFIGTDTLPAMDYAELYYDAPEDSLIAISVPATEHAVATSNILGIECSWAFDEKLVGKVQEGIKSGEVRDSRLVAETHFMKDLITRKFPVGIVSYVADSFDFWAVVTQVVPALKDVILSRQAAGVAPGKLVIRPDSGDPVKVVCGDEEAEEGSPEHKGAIECLWETFGGTITETGYKLLDSHIGLIYGDSITTQRAKEILSRLEQKGFASGNVVFGVGSYTYQCNTRDTLGFAVKATYTEVGGKGIAIFKDPKTDSKKKSAKGLLCVEKIDNEFKLYDDVSKTAECEGCLETIYEDGKFVKRTNLEEIRNRLS